MERSLFTRLIRLAGLTGLLMVMSWPCGPFVSSQAPASDEAAGPSRLETAPPGDCVACHGSKRVLPADHGETKKMARKDCLECHEEKTKSLRTRMPLSHTHWLGHVSCAECHPSGTSGPAPSTNQCLECHGSFETVARATRGMDPDPHNSPHYGMKLDCDLCHHQHAKSENFCAQCHSWTLSVP
ncbi:MAG: cytochrome c3 family protein [Proteobacteria bacterium]|nr:cytochrome c3 family protein [Pseudomonadota bacterium]